MLLYEYAARQSSPGSRHESRLSVFQVQDDTRRRRRMHVKASKYCSLTAHCRSRTSASKAITVESSTLWSCRRDESVVHNGICDGTSREFFCGHRSIRNQRMRFPWRSPADSSTSSAATGPGGQSKCFEWGNTHRLARRASPFPR